MSRPITDYTNEEVRAIILQGILAERKQPGTYFDPNTCNKLVIVENFVPFNWAACFYFVEYHHGPAILKFKYTYVECMPLWMESEVTNA